jgi:acetamidase/formamidase
MISRYHVDSDGQTTHDCFDRDRPPILTIDSGDTVVFSTLDSSWGKMGERMFNLPAPAFIHEPGRTTTGHALCGPVFIRGAEPGDVLEVGIDAMQTGSWGHTYAGKRPDLGTDEEVGIGWRLDADAGTATDTNGLGLTVPLRPFMGVMGNAPAEPGQHSTVPPRRVGGNIDCRELIAGSTLWLPVEMEGALFSVGDGHGAQGDGEVSRLAIECPMNRVELTFTVRKDLQLEMPQAETPAGFVTIGIGATVDEAIPAALNGMLDHLQRTYGLGRSHALALASVVVHLRITQIVNRTVGVHALLPPHAVTRASK